MAAAIRWSEILCIYKMSSSQDKMEPIIIILIAPFKASPHHCTLHTLQSYNFHPN
jgi:hypothetical protein